MSRFQFLGFLFGLFLPVLSVGTSSATESTSALLRELDGIVADHSTFETAFHKKTDQLKHLLTYTSDTTAQFDILSKLFAQYRNYRIDSALTVAERLIALSAGMDEHKHHKAQMHHADALNKYGLHSKALRVLDGIPRTDSVKTDPHFYYLCHTTCLSLCNEATNAAEKRFYKRRLHLYKDTLTKISTPGTIGFVSNKAGLLAEEGKLDEGIRLLSQFYDKEKGRMPGKDKASIEFLLAEMQLQRQDTAKALDFLIRASINDLKEAKKVYMSLQKLAMLLYLQGDTERAYTYIMKSMRDINEGRARYRIYDIAGYTPIISAAYELHVKQARLRNRTFSGILLLLVVALAVVFYLVFKKNHYLNETRRLLAEQNGKLQKMTENLKHSNDKLKDSDRIKIEYIGLLFNICSEYIKQQEELRKKIVRKIASNQYAEISKILNSHSSASDDFKQFIARFDTIFLSIFPDFVTEFNKFLRPEEQVKPKDDELLTPELRIYALIRLGITENAKIAGFLHYSLQTVYNYRQKMRNKLQEKGQSLSSLVLQIGQEY